MSRISGFMCRITVSLVVCGVLCSGSAFAQPEALKEAIKERLDRGDLPSDQIPIAKKIVKGLPNAGEGVFYNTIYDESVRESIFDDSDILITVDGAVDVQGDLVILGGVVAGPNMGSFLVKYDAFGNQKWIELAGGAHSQWALEVDIDGNIYIGFLDSSIQKYVLQKYSSRGFILWESEIDSASSVSELLVDADGNPYLVGMESGDISIHRHSPQNGVRIWQKFFSLGDQGQGTFLNEQGAAIDRFGQIRVGAITTYEGVLQNVVASIDHTGELLWSTYFPRGNNSTGPVLDSDCNAYIVDLTGYSFNVRCFDSNGSQTYLAVTPDVLTGAGAIEIASGASPVRIVVDLDSRVHVTLQAAHAGSGIFEDLLVAIAQISSSGQVLESTFHQIQNRQGFIANVRGLVIDRFGNPYISADHWPLSVPAVGRESTIIKLDKNNLSVQSWAFQAQGPNGAMPAHDVTIIKLFSDFGDNIYFVGAEKTNISSPPLLSRYGKLSQPYTAVPTIAKNSPNLQIHNQSLWGEFVGGVSSYTEFFQINHADTPFDIGLGETFSIPFLGDFGGTVDFNGSMALGMGFEATASGGAVNIDYPGNLDIAIPGSDKLVAGSPFTITAQFEAHSSGNIVSDATPLLSAGLKANVGLNINSGAELVAFSDPIATVPLVNANLGWEGLVPGLSMSLPTGSPGSWVDFGDERNIVSGRLTRPLFSSNGGINLNTGLIRSDLKPEVFFSLRGNLTNYISTYQFGTPTIYGISSGTSSAGAVGASVNIAQAFAEIKLEANQNLTFDPTVSTVYEFDPPVDIWPAVGGPAIATNQSSYEIPMVPSGSTWTGELRISVSSGALESSNNSVMITPKSKIVSTLHNRTWVDIQPAVGWETLAAEVHANAFGENLFGFEFCALCFNFPLTDDLPINLFDTTLNMPTTIVELDPITFLVVPNGNPRISGTSRARLSAFIYDQVDADPFELAAFINSPAKKMLIYGDNFFTKGTYAIDHFVFCSQGRIVALPTTILNSRTALVEIPNSMRLVPGIARIWAVSANPGEQGSPISESIDFPIELPVPNLGTAGPNLWAADPRLSNLAIDVIDGLTPSRTASFIARRDYWYVLADMWDAIDAGNGTGLFASYPIYDFTAEPPMPAVLIDLTEYPVLADTRHHWSFDGDFKDSVGTADGTPGGTAPEFVTEGVPSNLGEAAEFSGGKITVDRSAMTHMRNGDFTVAFWMKLNNSSSSNRTIFSSKAAGSSTGLTISVLNGKGYVFIGSAIGFTNTYSNGLVFPTDEKWHHYTLRIDRDIGATWFRNGVLETFEPVFGEFTFNALHSDSITIGMSNSDTNPLHGQLSDLNIFTREISDNEIQTLSSPLGQMPIGRFKQPVENGILYSLMPKSEYDEPKLVSISLDVAGPGGGKSNSIDLTVAAPQPVISNLIPRSIFPDAGEFVMTVEGPLSVPFFNGFEEERFGNFNKASVVLWDGIPLETTYVTPGTLEAVVPPEMTMLQGNALITVETPSNETGYFNSFTGGIVESGGESNAIPLDVSYPTPIITAMSPELTSKALIDRCPDNPGMVRLTITGEDFWPGATIWIDGVEHVTSVQSSKGGLILRGVSETELSYNVIYTDLDIADLSRIYSAPVVVMNPDGKLSEQVYLDIVDEAAYEAYYGVDLPPQLMPGECK